MLESTYQRKLIKKLDRMFPGCQILKNDPGYMQGVPDLVVFFHGQWAMLEVKASADSDEQPNQRYYVDEVFGPMSFAAFIYPENEEEVLDDLQRTFSSSGTTRVSQS